MVPSYPSPPAYGNPTSVDFVRCDSSQITVGYQSSDTIIFDLETGTPVVTLESKMPSGKIYMSDSSWMLGLWVLFVIVGSFFLVL